MSVKTHYFREVYHAAVRLEDALGNDEPPTSGGIPLVLLVLLLDLLEDALQALVIAVLVPPDGRARDLDAFLDRKVDAPVGDDDVAALAERGNDGGHATEGVGIVDRGGDVQESRNVAFELEVDICACESMSKSSEERR